MNMNGHRAGIITRSEKRAAANGGVNNISDSGRNGSLKTARASNALCARCASAAHLSLPPRVGMLREASGLVSGVSSVGYRMARAALRLGRGVLRIMLIAGGCAL